MTDKKASANAQALTQVQDGQQKARPFDPTDGRDPLLPWTFEDDGLHYLIIDGDGGEVGKVNNRNDAALIIHMVNGWFEP